MLRFARFPYGNRVSPYFPVHPFQYRLGVSPYSCVATQDWERRITSASNAHDFYSIWGHLKDDIPINRKSIVSLLTMQHQFLGPSVSMGQLREFNMWIYDALQTLLKKDPASLCLVVQRYGAMEQSAMLRLLAPVVTAFLDRMSSRDLAICLWNLAKRGVRTDGLWSAAGHTIVQSAPEFNAQDLQLVCMALQLVERRVPEEIIALAQRTQALLRSSNNIFDKETFLPFGTALKIAAAFAYLCPRNLALIQEIVQYVQSSVELKCHTLPASALAALWCTLADIRSTDRTFLEFACKQSRGLRLDPTLSRTHIRQITTALATLNIYDRRLVYQLLCFVRTRVSMLRPEDLVAISVYLARKRIYTSDVWKILARQFQKVSKGLTTEDIITVRNCFRGSKANNQALNGHLQELQRRSEEHSVYGNNDFCMA